jgi:CheY-like chemotaxis protein
MAEKPRDGAPEVRADWIRHEIRNPLNVLTGSLRLIEMSGVTPPQQKQVDLCRAAINRITAIVDSLDGGGRSDFAAKAAAELRALGHVSFLRKPFDRSDLLRTVQVAAKTHRNVRVLAADDVPEVGWLLEALLASTGCSLEMVRDGGAAISRAKDGTFDVILLDLEMPGTNGLEAARAIREQERAMDRDPVPLVIVSGHDLEHAPPPDDVDAGAEVVTPDPEIAELVPEFLENRRKDIIRLQMSIDAEDWEAVRSAGHRMKGTGRGYGFTRITDIGRSIEEAGANEDGAGAREAIAQLARYLDRVKVAPPPAEDA